MQIYVILIHYLVPLERIRLTIPAHRAYLDTYFEKNVLLFSGMQSSKTGGIIIMRAKSLEEVNAFIHNDPFSQEGLARFEPLGLDVRRAQPWIEPWIKGP